MRSRPLILAFVVFTVAFAVALWWFQTRAFYERVEGLAEIGIGGAALSVSGYRGIDAETSPLKMRGCFRVAGEAAALDGAEAAAEPTPLVAPSWFDCFDAEAIAEDLAEGRARAVVAARNEPDGFDRVVAVYPDGRGFQWRQLNGTYAD